MYQNFISLEWKRFFRSSNIQKGVALKVILGFFAVYMGLVFLVAGASLFFMSKKMFPDRDPLLVVNGYLIFWFLFDLTLRFFMQKLPFMNIKSFMILPLKKSTIVHYLLRKTIPSFFNILPLFIVAPFAVVLLIKDYEALQVISWGLSIMLLTLVMNFINFIINKSNISFYVLLSLLVIGFGLDYFNIISITGISEVIFGSLFNQPYLIVVPVILLLVVYRFNYNYLVSRFYLDDTISSKEKEAKTVNLSWLDKFGEVAPYLKNDIKLIWRNKRAKMSIWMSILFLSYGLIFVSDASNTASQSYMLVLIGVFMTGMFMINFGQFIPAWDSSYYKLIMAQNIPLKQYIKSKLILMVISVILLTCLATPYVYFGWKVLWFIIVCGIYNIGINVPVVLLFGAFNRNRIDVEKSGLMNYQGVGASQWLISIPVLVLPILIYLLSLWLCPEGYELLPLIVVGLIGLLLQPIFLKKITGFYRKYKYATIEAFQEKL